MQNYIKAIFEAETEHCNKYNRLVTLIQEERAKDGQKVYLIPVQFMITAEVTVYAENFDKAIEAIEELPTPPGEYMDGTFVINPDRLSEEEMIVSYIKK